MKARRHMKKVVSGLLCAALIFSNSLTMYAAQDTETVSTETSDMIYTPEASTGEPVETPDVSTDVSDTSMENVGSSSEASEVSTESTDTSSDSSDSSTESTDTSSDSSVVSTESTEDVSEAPTENTGDVSEVPTESTEDPSDASEVPTESTEDPSDASEVPTESTEDISEVSTEDTGDTEEPSEPTESTEDSTENAEDTEEPSETPGTARRSGDRTLDTDEALELDDTSLKGSVEGNYYVVNVTKSSISSLGAYRAVQNALDEARENATESLPYKVVVAAGTHELDHSLRIYSNTYLYMKNVTFTKKAGTDSNMLKVGDNTDTQAGYYYKNITLEGGTWNECGNSNTAIKIAHAYNFTMIDQTVKNVKNAHLIEAAGVDTLTIKGCTFADQTLDKDNEGLYYEAIQIDILVDGHFTGFRSEDLPMKNLTFDSCSFSNVPRAIGSHTAVLNSYVENIKITNCTFSNMKSAAIQSMNWKNCTITNNTITNAPRGIAFYTILDEATYLASTLAKEGNVPTSTPTTYVAPDLNQEIVIQNNTITCGGTDPYADYEDVGIFFAGITFSKAHKGEDGDKVPAGDYYFSGVTISNNTISSIGHGIRLENTKNSTVTDNTITYTGGKSSVAYHGIQLREASTNNEIARNTISSPQTTGIFVYSGSSASTISSNKITSAGKYGIDVENASTDTISGNTISDSADNGIYVYNKGSVSAIKDNTISSSGKISVNIDNASVGDLTGNTITTAPSHGIYLHNSASVNNISSNTLKSIKKHGIFVENSTAVTISSNKIVSPKANGIYLYNKGNSTTISKNTISSAGNSSINVDNASADTITANTLSSPTAYGVYLHNSATVKEISDNTLNSAKKSAIFVENSTATTISGNKIESPTVNGIYLYNKGKSTTISENTISSPGKYGIDVENATASTISKNTVTKPSNHGIFVQKNAKTKTITGNTVSSGKTYGISVNAIKQDLTISSNKVSKCKNVLIYLNPNTTSYKITVNKNTLTGTSSVDGIYAPSGKVDITDNTIKSAKNAIVLSSSKVKGTVSGNTFSKNKVNAVVIASKQYKTLAKPTSLKASKKSKTSISLSWKKVTNADGYIIYRSTSKDSGYKKCTTLSGKSKVKYTDTKLKSGKTYYYKVAAYRESPNGKITMIGSESKAVSKKL